MTSHARVDYHDFEKAAPGVRAGLSAVGKAIDESGLEKTLTELVKLRASQLNGCSFCLRYHLNEARKHGLSEDKIDLVAAWRDATDFTARERAALAWAEALTDIARADASDALYAELLEHFSLSEAAFLTAAIAQINAWNRIAVALRFSPPPAMRAQKAA